MISSNNSHSSPDKPPKPDTELNWGRGDWMQTWTGKQFFPLDPRVEDIDPIDMARALSMQCRYNGHTSAAYSIAEHCVLISQAVCPEHALAGLLHDATEAYLGDVVRPLKRYLDQYIAAEDRLWYVITTKYGLEPELPPCVHDADTRILIDEREVLLSASPAPWGTEHLEPLGVHVQALPQPVAEQLWLDRLAELTGPTHRPS